MWDKYADNSKGFCVGFDSLKLFKSGLIGSGGIVDYVDELPTLKPPPYMSGRDSTLKQIFCKLKKWSFEKEYRLHIFRGEKLTVEDRRVIAPADTFKEIIIGSNMPDGDLLELKNQLHIDLKQINIRNQ